MHDETIPVGLCQCGCGRKTTIPKATDSRRGHFKGRPIAFIKGHNRRTRNVPACGYVVADRGYSTPCWVWSLYVAPDGYARVVRDGHLRSAHVAFWTDIHGPVPEGMELDHLCRVRPCVNPDHLESVTHAENIRRSRVATLTAAEAAAIRVSLAPTATLVAEYGVTATTIRAIRRGAIWKP